MASFGDNGMLALKLVVWLVFTLYYMLEALVGLVLPWSYSRKDIKGDIALVTGGGMGIGRLMCRKLAARGAVIVTWDISEAANEETKRQIVAAGGKCHTYTVDLCDRHAVYATAAKVKKEVGKVDILVNNAGIVTGDEILKCPDEHIIKTFEVNSLAIFWTTKAFLADMYSTNKGHLVTIASMAGHLPLPRLVDYCASKFAAVGYHETMRQEVWLSGKTGVQTTCVCPMYINTGMFEGVQPKFCPAMDPDWVATKVVDGILMNMNYVKLPAYMKLYHVQKFLLPEKSRRYFSEIAEFTTVMDRFVGRKKPQ